MYEESNEIACALLPVFDFASEPPLVVDIVAETAMACKWVKQVQSNDADVLTSPPVSASTGIVRFDIRLILGHWSSV